MKRLLVAAVFASSPLFAADPPKLTLPEAVSPVAPSLVTRPNPTLTTTPVPTISTPTVVVQVMLLQAPTDFAESAGLTPDPRTKARSWSLTPREAKMLTALIRASKGDSRVGVLTHPTLVLQDQQTGHVDLRQRHEVLGPLTVTEEKGERFAKAKLTPVDTGIRLRLTPTVARDPQSVTVKAEVELSCLEADKVSFPAESGHVALATHSDVTVVENGKSKTIAAAAVSTAATTATLKLAPDETRVIAGLGTPNGKDYPAGTEVLMILHADICHDAKK